MATDSTRRAGVQPAPIRPADSAGSVIRLRISTLKPLESLRNGGLDADHIRLLSEIADGLPPILVHEGTLRVIDGMHRVAAAERNGATEIDARLYHGSIDDAFCLGVQANITHGLPLSADDRRAAVARIVRSHPHLSDRSICGIAGVGARTVAAVRRELTDVGRADTRLGNDGRSRPLSAEHGRRVASRFIAEHPEASLREIARCSGISVGTAKDVRSRVLMGEDPVPAPRVTARIDGSTVRRADNLRQQLDPAVVLDTLLRDPALRYTDAGRTQLRWLTSRFVTEEQWRGVMRDVPQHCRESVAQIARHCATVWSAIAQEAGRA